jgi:transcriptional regulator with XRE-family HTH domain
MYFFELGSKIREARLKAGATQAELALAAGLGRTTINQLEAGVCPDLGLKKVTRLLRAVGLDLAVVSPAPQRPPDYLRMACVSANVSLREQLTPEQLAQALLTGRVVANYRPHLRVIFEEVPGEVVAGALRQVAGAAHPLDRVLERARSLAHSVGSQLKVSL